MKANKRSKNTIDKECKECGKQFLIYKSTAKYQKYNYCSIKCSSKNKEHTRGENNYAWKGEDAGYYTLHSWVRRKKGKPKQCSICGKSNGKLEWTNIDHKYRRDLDDYRAMCVSCHRKYDYEYILDKYKKNCQLCGKEYWCCQVNRKVSKFCSNNCKTKNYRLKKKHEIN